MGLLLYCIVIFVISYIQTLTYLPFTRVSGIDGQLTDDGDVLFVYNIRDEASNCTGLRPHERTIPYRQVTHASSECIPSLAMRGIVSLIPP